MSGRAVSSLVVSAVSCAVAVALAIPTSMVTLVGLAPVFVWHAAQVLTAITAAAFGFLSLRDIKREDGRRGRGMALTAIAISTVATFALMPAVLVALVLPAFGEAKHQIQSM